MRLMPFNFERLSEGRNFISNLAGFSAFLSDDELLGLITNQSTGSTALDQRLIGRQFLTSDQNLSSALTASALAKKLTAQLTFNPIFMIIPTLRCDHSCSYCQVSRASVKADGFDLSEELIPTILQVIKSLSTPPYKLEIQGGEPLLRFDLVRKIYLEAERALGANNFEMVIATSLSLLKDDIVSWAKERKIYFSTSLDGTKFVHDKNRILPRSSSYDRLKDAILKINEQLGAHRVATVTTVTKDLLSDPNSLIDACIDLGISDIFVRPISPYGFASAKDERMYSVAEFIAFYKALFSAILAVNTSGRRLVEHSASIHMKRLLNPEYCSYADLKSPSGYLLNCLLFNYDGKVYGSDEARMIQRSNPGQDFSLGTVSDIHFKSELHQYLLASSFNLFSPGCDTCAFQPYCGADPCQSISVQGEAVGDKSRSFFCQYHKAMFTLLLEHYDSNSSARELLETWCHA